METRNKKITLSVEISYSIVDRYGEETQLKEEVANEIATSLAIRPNFHTIEEGVFLDGVTVYDKDGNPSASCHFSYNDRVKNNENYRSGLVYVRDE